MIADLSHGGVHVFGYLSVQFACLDVNECHLGNHVSYTEGTKVNMVGVVGQFAKELRCGGSQGENIRG